MRAIRNKNQIDNKPEQIKMRLRRPIIIVGMMCVGKSTLAPRLASVLGVPFYDTDREIERAAGCKVSEVFSRDGQEKFREVEKETLKNLMNDGLCVIATGGGTPMDPETAHLIFSSSVSIWVQAKRDDLLERLKNDTTRPLLQNSTDLGATIDKLLEERQPIYSKADIDVTWQNPNPNTMVRGMIAKLHDFLYG